MAETITTQLAHPRDTQPRLGDSFDDGVKADEVIFKGAGVLKDSSGYLINAKSGATGVTRGVAQKSVDATGYASGALKCPVRSGMFEFHNYSGDPVADGDCEQIVYWYDNHSIAKSNHSGDRPVAGRLKMVTSDGKAVVAVGPLFSVDGDLISSNNLSDVASAATARANIGANVVDFNVLIDDLVGSDAKRYGFAAPHGFVITKIKSVLLKHALGVGDATLTAKIAGTSVTGGVITITQSGSAIGDCDTCTPSAAKTATEDQFVEILVGGTNTDTAAQAMVTFTCTR